MRAGRVAAAATGFVAAVVGGIAGLRVPSRRGAGHRVIVNDRCSYMDTNPSRSTKRGDGRVQVCRADAMDSATPTRRRHARPTRHADGHRKRRAARRCRHGRRGRRRSPARRVRMRRGVTGTTEMTRQPDPSRTAATAYGRAPRRRISGLERPSAGARTRAPSIEEATEAVMVRRCPVEALPSRRRRAWPASRPPSSPPSTRPVGPGRRRGTPDRRRSAGGLPPQWTARRAPAWRTTASRSSS
jgi:hypothetical protein